jgi:hypothetical protein
MINETLLSIFDLCQQGCRPPILYDLSKGVERVPVLFFKDRASSEAEILDQSFSYVRIPILHPSVLLAACFSKPFSSASAPFSGLDNIPQMVGKCDCLYGIGGCLYGEGGILRPQYIKQVHASIPSICFNSIAIAYTVEEGHGVGHKYGYCL